MKAGFTYRDILKLDEPELDAYFDEFMALQNPPKKDTGVRAKTYTVEVDDDE